MHDGHVHFIQRLCGKPTVQRGDLEGDRRGDVKWVHSQGGMAEEGECLGQHRQLLQGKCCAVIAPCSRYPGQKLASAITFEHEACEQSCKSL